MFNNYKGSRFVVWIRIKVDPHEQFRGFSIQNRELRVQGYEPVRDEMQDIKGGIMAGQFWVVEEAEVMRVIPEMHKYRQNKAWFFPIEFCEPFVRPYDYLNFKVRDIKLT